MNNLSQILQQAFSGGRLDDEVSPYRTPEEVGTPSFIEGMNTPPPVNNNYEEPAQDDGIISGYRDLLGSQPKREDYQPRTRDKIVGGLTSALSAFGDNGSVQDAVNVGKGITEGPYKRAMGEWETSVAANKPMLNTSVQMTKADNYRDRGKDRKEVDYAKIQAGKEKALADVQFKIKKLESEGADSRAIQGLRQQELQLKREAEVARQQDRKRQRDQTDRRLGQYDRGQNETEDWHDTVAGYKERSADQADERIGYQGDEVDRRNEKYGKNLDVFNDTNNRIAAQRSFKRKLFQQDPINYDMNGEPRTTPATPEQVQRDQKAFGILLQEEKARGVQ